MYQVELQNLGISTNLYTEMLIRPVYDLQDVSQAEEKARLAVHKHYKSHPSFSVYMWREMIRFGGRALIYFWFLKGGAYSKQGLY